MVDVIISGGWIVDGTGRPSFPGEVGIEGDRIAWVRAGPRDAGPDGTGDAQRIDATGLVVAPGIIDIHTHSDFTLLEEPDARSVLRQGVTTEVIGNCGQSYAPVSDRNRVNVEGRSGGWQPGVTVDWSTVGEYLDRVRAGNGANSVFLVGHGAIRSAVMGMDDRPATDEEVADMARLLEASLDDGAWGLSLGLEYPPGRSAATEELATLAGVVGRRGALLTAHVRNRDRRFEPSIDEIVGVATAAGARLQLSHLLAKPKHAPGAWERVVESLERARDGGLDVAADTIPYDTGPGFATAFLPGWAVEGGPSAILERLRDPDDYARIRTDYGRYWLFLEDDEWDRLTVSFSDAHPDWLGERFDVLAERLGIEPIDVLLRLFLDEGEGLDRVAVNGRLFPEEHVRQCLVEPTFAISSDGWRGTRDGGPGEASNHPNGWGMVPLVLGHYVRDERILSLEEATRRMTSYPALRLGLVDRGILRAGAYADILVFDPEAISTTSNYAHPAALPTGISQVFVNGQHAVRDGALTGVRAGRVL